MQRAAEHASRAQARAAREVERSQRQRERERLANEKERLNLSHEHHEEEAESRNRDLGEAIKQVSNLLNDAVGLDHRLKFERLKAPLKRPEFDPGPLAQAEEPPRPENYRLKPPGFFARLIPGVQARHQLAIREARIRFDGDVTAHGEREKSRQVALYAARTEHEARVRTLEEKLARQHADIDALKSEYQAGSKEAVRQYCETVLSSQSNPDGWPQSFRIAFVPESKQVVVEYDFPGFDIISQVAAHKYVRSKKEIITTQRSEAERRRLYTAMIAQATLRIVHVLFNADHAGHVESIVFNGHVHAIDQATGHQVHPCIVTLRTTRSVFSELELTRIDAETCLKGLNASVSKRPTELAPVRPVLDFNMVDPRFVHEEEILAGLDNRSNLMDLNPGEFESLITNLFTKMGLETRQTRPSRDGGVDCVAYDPRPIFGGKVVIQAKRYKNTVGVSAVRDLYGTVQNEGASKGILVTTSGFGKASFEFASGKPLELLDGSNLLYLLTEHAGIEAKIEVPEDWKDPGPDLGE
jgi:restriction system protein